MSEIRLTPEQSAAIGNTGGALLVSAAAGSGKTFVLVERLLNKVMVSPNTDVDDFLIITYTNAAAAELRGKIMDAIYERIAADPENRMLRRQADKCGSAEIETIHGFCLGIIRENAHTLGIGPDVRIADETESDILKQEVLSDVLDSLYEAGDSSFLELADTFGAGRDDSALVDIIIDAHTKLMSHPYPERWVEEQKKLLSEGMDGDAAQTPWGQIIMSGMKQFADYWIYKFGELISDAQVHPDFIKAYGDSMYVSFEGLKNLREALNKSWDEAREAFNVEFPKPAPISGFDELKDVRTNCKKAIEKQRLIMWDNSERALSDMKKIAPTITALLDVVLKFDETYSACKRRRGVLDFSDQEHLALNVLVDKETGEPTETARAVSKRYAEIMVDEYQDVNAIQEAIFGAVSQNGNNVFMVGDVKQSIYRFRLADPSIFLSKYTSYKDASDASEGEGRSVVLSCNFRSRKEVLDAVNYVFSNVMSTQFGEMDYTKKEALNLGAKYPENPEAVVELDIVDMKGDDGDDSDDKAESEAKFAAGRILELVGSYMVSDGNGGLRPAKYGDIAVIMRSPKKNIAKWTAVFAQKGIPLAAPESGEKFYESAEVSVILSMLAVIDNPRQDIPLISTFRSPVYGFSSDELANIRADCRNGDFYTALVKAAETDAKCAAFLDDLSDYRRRAPDMTSDAFLWYVMNKTNMFAVANAMQGSEKRRENLMMLLESAKKFESAGYKGLFGFASYMRGMMERHEPPFEREGVSAENAVRIMSTHKSKGLEFPIVILADLTRGFNQQDAKKQLLIHPKLGAGPKITDTRRRIAYPSLAKRAISRAIVSENLAEELRILYVAMTRAKEKLIMLCTFANAEKEIMRISKSPLPVPPQMLSSARSSADWILLPALRRGECKGITEDFTVIPSDYEGEPWNIRLIKGNDDGDENTPIPENDEKSDDTEVRETVKKLKGVLNWKYAYSDAENIPSKITATELKGGVLASEAAEEAETLESAKREVKPPYRPDFTGGRRKLTAAEKGTAAHLVMQYADYSKCLTVDGAKSEIERIHAMGNLTDQQAEAVDPCTITGFFSSDAGKAVTNADKLWRELKFSILVDSGLLPEMASGEEVLLQGVVDCCVQKNGKLTIIDFKTDYVTDETVSEKAQFYKGQLDAYALAMERVLGMPVEGEILYFMTAGKCVEIK